VTCHRRTALLAALACALVAPAARATPVPIQGVRWEVDSSYRKGQWLDNLGQSCVGIRPVDWSGASTRADFRKKISRWVESPPARATGSFDGVSESGRVSESTIALEFSRVVKPFTAINLENVGIELRGGRGYVTGSFTKPKSYISAAKRVQLAVIAHPKLFKGPALDRKHRPIPNTFLMAVQGNATIAPGLAKALNRFRCTKPVGVLRPRPVKIGAPFGFVTVQMLPAAGAGTGGTVDLIHMKFDSDSETDVSIHPVAPATSVRVHGETGIRFVLGGDNRVPLECQAGSSCIPTAGGKLGIAAGGFTVALNGRMVTVDSIEGFYAGSSVEAGLVANVNGQRMTIVNAGGEASNEFLAALSGALGATFSDGFIGVTTTFTATGPL
jgi:hypothetical protein